MSSIITAFNSNLIMDFLEYSLTPSYECLRVSVLFSLLSATYLLARVIGFPGQLIM